MDFHGVGCSYFFLSLEKVIFKNIPRKFFFSDTGGRKKKESWALNQEAGKSAIALDARPTAVLARGPLRTKGRWRAPVDDVSPRCAFFSSPAAPFFGEIYAFIYYYYLFFLTTRVIFKKFCKIVLEFITLYFHV